MEIELPEATLVLSPLERRIVELEEDTVLRLVKRTEQRSELDIQEIYDYTSQREELWFRLGAVAVPLTLWLLIGAFYRGAIWRAIGVLVLVGSAAALLPLAFHRKEGERKAFKEAVRQLGRRLWQSLVLLTVLLVAVALPTAALYHGTELGELVSLDSRGISVIDGPLRTLVVGRLLQLLLIIVASLLPALMYFQFDRERLSTLRDRWLRNIFRLDPAITTLSDVEAAYGPQMAEVFGRRGTGRLPGRRLSPILVTTLVLTVSWVLILLNPQGSRAFVASGSIPPDVSIIDLVAPERSATTFAFLGAYFFALHLVARAYVRGDLRPKTYAAVTVRVLVVVILAWLLETLVAGDDRLLFYAAFVAGVVPTTAFRWIRDVGPSFAGAGLLEEGGPLTHIEGIDLYERTRLGDEGITNVESLAHHDLIDLTLNTRIPIPRIVDWVDQAILYLHLGAAPPRTDVGEASQPPEEAMANLRRLRAYGIRTATDLWYVRNEMEKRGERWKPFCRILLPSDGDGSVIPPRLAVALDTIVDDEWFDHLLKWRRWPAEGRGTTTIRYQWSESSSESPPVPLPQPDAAGAEIPNREEGESEPPVSSNRNIPEKEAL